MENSIKAWRYQVIFHDDDKHPWYGLHEVYIDKDGKPISWTVDPEVVGESVEVIQKTLKMMMDDIEKIEVLKYSELKENDATRH